jgi:O-methyltransferase involved in polyketide biosynthesis
MTSRPGRTGSPSGTRGFDPRTPSIARVYDYLLGGKDNFAADRAVADKLLAVYPPVIETVPESRRFVERAVTWVAGQGITQFIDLGAGLPTDPNTHATAQAANPAAAVAYVDNDPVVISHLTALLAHPGDRIAVIAGDLHDRDATLGDAGMADVIDLSKPVCVIMGMILHFDTLEAATGLVKTYVSAVAPGSYLIATIASGKGARADEFYQTYNATGFATMYNHSPADFASFFGDLEIVPPGLGDARRIRPGWSELMSAPRRPDRILAGIARVP